MKLKELMKIKPGAILLLSGTELDISKVIECVGASSGWTNLVSLARTGQEVVLEIEDRKIRVWLEKQKLPLDVVTMASMTDINTSVIIYDDARFKLCEGPSQAKTTSITKEGAESGKLRFSVFCLEDYEEIDERMCVEDRGGRLVAYHSPGFFSIKNIRVK